jgi:CheY-like chemotaxis protein
VDAAAVPRVLLVDDEVSAAEVLALILDGEGIHATVAADGRQALERLEQAAPHVLVSDFMMPGMNGAELVAAVRARAGYEHMPVMFISGAPESALSRLDVRYDAFLRKPFELERFLDALFRLLAAAGVSKDRPERG